MVFLYLMALLSQELPIEMDPDRWEALSEDQKKKEAIRLVREQDPEAADEEQFSRLIAIGRAKSREPESEETERFVMLGISSPELGFRGPRTVSIYYFSWNDGVFGAYQPEFQDFFEIGSEFKNYQVLGGVFTAPAAAVRSGATYQGCHTEWTDVIAFTDEGPRHVASFQSGYRYNEVSVTGSIRTLTPGQKFTVRFSGTVNQNVIFIRRPDGKYTPDRNFDIGEC